MALLKARVDATSATALASKLIDVGVTPISIEPVSEKQPSQAKEIRLPWGKAGIKLDDLIVFCRQMLTLTEAGLPIVGAIKGLAGGARSPAFAQVLDSVADALQSGRELSSAMQQHPKVFSNLFVSVINVGENTGRLDESFGELSRYLELERETQRHIKAATRYPTMVMLAIAGAMVMINLLVLPAFADTFKSMNQELPLATQILVSVSDLTLAYWPHLAVAIGFAVAGVRAYVNTPAGRFLWHKYKLQLPAMGSIIKRATLARYARTFAMTAHSGLPLNRTLEIVSRAVDNDFIASRIAVMRRSIERGESLTRAAASCGLFSPLVLQMMGVGEQTGTLAEMHRNIASSYEGEVEYDLGRMSDLIEPILIIGVGGIVLVLALGIYLPMWDFGR